MNINFELALSRLANDPTDLVAWSVILDAFENKVSTNRTINGNSLVTDITLLLASDDFLNQGTSTTVLHGNAAGNPSWGSITTNDITDANITLAKIQNVTDARILGRITSGSGVVELLTGTQITTLLDLFSTSATTKGLVPGSNNLGNTYFLRADNSWAIPPSTTHSTLTNLSYASSGHTGFEPAITSGTNLQYWRGDKTWQSLTGLGAGTAHNSLSSIQGGSLTERYHLSLAGNTIITGSPIIALTTDVADIVPTGLTCSSTGVSMGNDGSVSAYVVITWDAVVSSIFDHYKIRYKKTALTYYTYLESTANTIMIDGLTPNTSYDFGVASVNKYGTESAFSANISQITAADTVAPAAVTIGSANAGIQYVIVEWTQNSESDLASYNVYRNTTNNSGTSSLIGNCRTNYFIDGGKTGGQIYYYWVKAVDTSGNESVTFSSEVHATPRNVVSLDTALAHQGWNITCVFTVTDLNTVAWSGGSLTTSSGVVYTITGGDTGNMAAKTYIFLDTAVSTTLLQTTTTAANSVGDTRILIAVAQNGTTEATYFVFNDKSMNINAAEIVAGSITANEIATGTITATQIDTTSITSLSNLAIAASQVLIDGTVYLSNWRKAGDITKIDGGSISANTITTTQLNFTPITGGNVIASINASAEGIKIDADNITISGSTTFSAGYDPTGKTTTFAQAGIPTSVAIGDIWIDTDDDNKTYRAAIVGADQIAVGEWVLYTESKVKTFAQDAIPTSLNAGDIWYDTNDGNKMYRAVIAGADQITAGEWVEVPDNNKLNNVGGSYASAASGARVLVFPDANTGIQIIDGAAFDVFKVMVGGADIGDVTIGNWAGGQGIKYDNSGSGATSFKGTVTASAGTIGGWTIDADSIYTGTEQTSDGYSTSGITLHNDGSLHAPNFYINADGTNNIAGITLAHLVRKAASATVRNSYTIETGSQNTPYQLKKTIRFTNGLLGAFRVIFDLKKVETGGGGNGYGKLYHNGVAFGTEQVASLGVYATKSQDFTHNLLPGDTIEIWLYSENSDVTTYTEQFDVCYSDDPIVEVASTNV